MVLENSYFDHINNPYAIESTAAQLRQSGSIVVSSTGDQTTNGSAFTPSSFYSYTLDKAADVPALLAKYTGPQANIGIDGATTDPGTGTGGSSGGVATGAVVLRSGASGKCLEVPGGTTANGTPLTSATCETGAARQTWTVTTQGAGFRLVNGASQQCVDVAGGSSATGTALQQWGCAAQANQTWTAVASSQSGKWQVRNASSGLCLAVKDGSTASGAPIVQEACDDAAKVQWSGFTAAGSGGGTTTPTTTTVAGDGTGTYKTVQAAVDAIPSTNTTRQVITVKPGTYREIVTVNKPFVTLRGTGSTPQQTVVVNNRSSAGGYGTSGSATFFVKAKDLVVENLTLSNDYGEGSQAVAVNVDADRATFRNVRFLGNQDTLLLNSGRSYIVDSYVEGTVDFIFGGGTAVLDRASIYQRRSTGGPITAAKTDAAKPYGFLIYRSTITGATNNTTQLGRPWGQDAQVLYRETSMSATMATAQPWIDMSGNVWSKARFREYKNTGAGATANGNRPQLSDADAASYTPARYLAGADGWNPIG
nr:pectinesterase family protein [Cellulomonas sp. JH27-2]